ncbi:PACE efflux transporter [Ectopseudomonas mendocina]|uniref:PACE efflux transporter n=1 Tax=Ectopseudomonas mendocina TaxID=300 RepID=A0ABZ2RGR7_ECTME
MTALAFSAKERIIHAVGFELLLILIATPLMALALDKPLQEVGTLTLALCVIAMFWNMVYNALVDICIKTERIHWNLGSRITHALVFELGLIITCVPLAAWLLNISLLQALLLDIVFLALILPYTVGYNWVFDQIKYTMQNSKRLPANEPA